MSYSLHGTLFSPEDLAKAKEILESVDINIILRNSVEERVLKAAELWLRQDLACDAMLVEHEFDRQGGGKGIVDLALRSGNRAWIVDWKTTGSVKRPNFVAEISSDFQSSLYLAHAGDYLEELWGVRPEFIEYRCLDEQNDQLSFRVALAEHTKRDANTQLLSIQRMYEGLSSLPLTEPWPRNRPRACFRGSHGGPTCPYWKDCTQMTMPPTPADVKFEEHVPRSKSSMKSLIECPERYRRDHLFSRISLTNDDIKVGVAFHEVVALLWQTSWNNLKESK